jgi:ribosomal protein S18 acetylase RimI-like enzyme
MPDEYLDGLSAEERARMWSGVIADADPSRAILVVLDPVEEVVGFAAAGRAEERSEPEGASAGEVYAINIDPDRWGQGYGRALLRAAELELSSLGYRDAVLWVVPGNRRARRFYEAARWTADEAERTQEVLGVVVPEVRYRRILSQRSEATRRGP